MESSESPDEKELNSDVQLNFPESVMNRIEELMRDTEQFDNAEFDCVGYINRMFPTEQSLSGVEAAAARCEWRLAGVGKELAAALQKAPARAMAPPHLQEARRLAADLALQVGEMKSRAEHSESTVREITSEMKRLDRAKSNLTVAITALNHYHMLVRGVSTLRTMTDQRQYKEIMMPLQAIMEVLKHLEAYRDIKELSSLHDQVLEIRRQLSQQITTDVKDALSGNRSGGTVSVRSAAEACAVLDVLDGRARDDLLRWLVEQQLQEYQVLFAASQETAWLPHLERRYSWLKKHLLAFEQRLGALLPANWAVSERIAHHFCEITRTELAAMTAARRNEIDVKLLLYAIQKTTNFEELLHKRFNGDGGGEMGGSQPSKEQNESEGTTGYVWRGAISSCFEPHLDLYIASLDNNLRTLNDRFLKEAREGSGGGEAEAAVAAGGAVLASCADLFLLYKKCLVQCAQLSTGEPMLQLAGVFQKYLREYANSVLRAALPGGGGGGGAGTLVTNLQTLLRDDAHTTRYSKEEILKITSVITTSEYCLETMIHLEHKLKQKIISKLSDKIDLTAEQELFHKTIEECVGMLVRELEAGCDAALVAMARVPWAQVGAVGDCSPYVAQLASYLRAAVPPLRDALSSSRKYFTQLCVHFANSFIPKVIGAVYKCRPLSTAGAEQLLLDMHTLKTALLELPGVGSDVRRTAPAAYTKVVVRLMGKAEMLLKLVMAPAADHAAFVAQFVQLLPDCTLTEFHKVLEMKGLKLTRAQHHALDALFRQHSAAADKQH